MKPICHIQFGELRKRNFLLNKKLFHSYLNRYECYVHPLSVLCEGDPIFKFELTGVTTPYYTQFKSFEDMEEFVIKNLFKNEWRERKIKELGL